MHVEKIKIDGVRGSYLHTEHVEVIVDYVVDGKYYSSGSMHINGIFTISPFHRRTSIVRCKASKALRRTEIFRIVIY